MAALVLSVLSVTTLAGAVLAGGLGYDPPPVYRHKSSLQSRRRPFQSTLQPLAPYDDPLFRGLPSRPYIALAAGPYRDFSHSPDGSHHQYGVPPYGASPYAELLRSLLGDYPRDPHGDYRLPYGAYPGVPHQTLRPPFDPVYPPLSSDPDISRSGKYLKPLLAAAVPPPVYPTKYPQRPTKAYAKPPVYRKRNATTTARPYSFSYDLVDVRGNDFGAAEESDGRQVQGQYSVLLPDGRLQTVSYAVEGDSGFVADVQYEGEARFVNEAGEEEARSSVKTGRGPTGGFQGGRRA